MLYYKQSLPTTVSRILLSIPYSLLQQLRAKSTRRLKVEEDDEEERRKSRKRSEDQENRVHLLKSRGQHLLTNSRVLDSIVRTSNIKPTDTVLEIGPGSGNLTLKLLEVAEKVVAIEIDKRMVEILRKRVAERGSEDRLIVLCGDALKTEFPQFDLVVANIPYGISSPLVAKLVFGERSFRSATLLLQKEFARRLLANPGDSEFNRLAVNVKLVADVKFVMNVSKKDFVPCPKVDSSVVKIYPKTEIPQVDLAEWCAFTRMCFSKKNKTLGATFKQKRKLMELLRLASIKHKEENGVNNCIDDDQEDAGTSDEEEYDLSSFSGMETNLFKDRVIDVLKSGSFDDKRPTKLSNEDLLKLLALFNQNGVFFHRQPKRKDANTVEFAASH